MTPPTGSTRRRPSREPVKAEPSWPADAVERRRVAELVPYARNARTHSPQQVAQIAASIREWGWTIPVLIDDQGTIIAGHGRVLAAHQLALDTIPVMIAHGWTDAQKRAYRLADNQLALGATWNKELLRIELADLRDQAVDLELMGFAAEDAIEREAGGASELPQGLQLVPPREYALVMCDDAEEWERLKVLLDLTPVRRGGYKQGSVFDDVGTQRVVRAADLFKLIDRSHGLYEHLAKAQNDADRSAK